MSTEIEDIYDSLLKSGMSEKEIKDEVKEKTEELKGFMTQKGALFLIAKEKGISISPAMGLENSTNIGQDIDYNEFLVRISDLTEGMDNLVLLGRIRAIYETKAFQRKDGTPGMVGSFLLQDASGTIRVVFWGEHVDMMKSEVFRVNEIIRIIGAYSKMNREKLEVHLGRKGKAILAPDDRPGH